MDRLTGVDRMVPPALTFILFKVAAFVVGTCIGSFLNVVIYRLPLDMSVNEPRRSFCPHCKNQIPFSQNIPLFSWLALRGKCARCGEGIAFRYFAVELLTGLLFLVLWLQCDRAWQWELVLPLWTLTGLLIVATFIDFDHYIIPDQITMGGTVAGLVFSFALPGLMEQESHWMGLLWSLAGAACGCGLLWAVVEAGKLAFGKRKLKFDPPADFRWVRQGDDADFTVGEDAMRWSDIFSRESDLLILEAAEAQLEANDDPAAALPSTAGEGGGESRSPDTATDAQIGGELVQPDPDSTLRFFYNRLLLPGRESAPILLDSLKTICGKVKQIVIPREAMGFGDVKFIACIGAFLGWKAVLFTIVAASVFGSIVGVALLLLGRREASGRIPFGPYLALGAFFWMFAGPAVIAWYWGFLVGPQ